MGPKITNIIVEKATTLKMIVPTKAASPPGATKGVKRLNSNKDYVFGGIPTYIKFQFVEYRPYNASHSKKQQIF